MSERMTIGIAMVKRVCELCAKPYNAELLMDRRLHPESLNGKVGASKLDGKVVGWLEEPCEQCKKYMERGIIIVALDPEKSDKNAPQREWHRTGGWWVVTEAYVKRAFADSPLLPVILKNRSMFLDHALCLAWGLYEAKPSETLAS